jgi:hypothetical protein
MQFPLKLQCIFHRNRKINLEILMEVGQLQLTPVILATQEAKIRRIAVRNQPGQVVHDTLSQKKKKTQRKKGLLEWLKV